MREKTLLVISQVYLPDPAAVGQYLHDVAVAMVERGFAVTVITSDRGYDDPTQRFAKHEIRDGVNIHRVGFSSTGKKTIATRLIGQFAFLFQATLRGLSIGKLAGVMISTSPPMAALAALVIHAVRRIPIKFWLMDLNPDQAVAMGKVRAGSLPVKMFDWLNRRLYRSAADVIVLDRFMAERVNAKLNIPSKITVLPTWPLETHLDPVAHELNPFRKAHGLLNKFVFMYSGNMSVASPLSTLLQAAMKLRDHPESTSCSSGEGWDAEKWRRYSREHKPTNITLLPYQPLEQLRYSLSAADVHMVTLGDNMVGIIHPCKVYGALAVARPILFCGPEPSHISELITDHKLGWQVRHGDVEGCVQKMLALAQTPTHDLQAMGQAGRELVANQLGKQQLGGRMGDVLARGL
ncbi:MAG: glycosyltransferase family 4 protein [Phycisphaerales bacterium]|nr:glycosyltransferase family 4 protein [Phycisphaerales bacterium]